MIPKMLFAVTWHKQYTLLKTQTSAYCCKYELVYLRSLYGKGHVVGFFLHYVKWPETQFPKWVL